MSDLPDVQPYLKSICNHYAQWWKDYAFIDEIDASTWFEFELTSRTEDKPKSFEEKPPDKLPPQPVLQAIENYANEKILIVGSSGAGKSTLLARIFWQAAERARHDETAPIPVLVELKAYQLVGDRSGIRGLILNSLESHAPSLDSDDLKKLLKQKRLMLLVDGLNELQQPQAKTELKSFCLNIPLIATARHAGDGWEIERKLELQPLSQLQVRDFLEVRLPTSDRDRLQELSDRVQDFGQTPLMVWMLYCIFRTGNEIPETRGEAYRKFTNLYVERSKEGVDLDESRFLLSRLAFGMMQFPEPGDPTDFQLDISEVDAQNLLGSEKELKLLRDCHLLQSFGESGKRRLRFCHQSLQEYYAAEYLLIQLPKLLENQQGNDDLKSTYLNYLKWTEPVALMLALVESEAQAVRVVELALEVDLKLGARLIGMVKSEFQSRMVTFIEQLSVPRRLKVTLLGMTATIEAIRYLEEALKTEDLSIRRRSIEALSKIRSEATIPALMTALNDGDVTVRLEATEALANIQSGEAITSLMNMIRDAEPLVRDTAAHGLKAVDTDTLIVHLQQALLNQQVNIRMQAIEVIEATREEAAIKLLLQASRDINHEIGWKAAHVLAKVNGESAIKHLSEALNNENMEIRRRAVYSLGEIRGANVVESLSKAVADKDIEVRKQAIEALGKVGGASIDKPLIQALEDKNLEIRRQALHALARSGNPSTIETLALYVNDKDPEVCQEAAYALGEIGDDRLTNVLLQALDNEDSGVRRCVIEALGKIGNDTAIDALQDALRDVSLEVREEAASALGRFGNDKIEDDFPDDEDDWDEWEGLERVVWDEDLNEEKFESLETEFNESEEEDEESIRDTVADEDFEITYIPSKLWTALLESDEPIKNEDFEDLGNDEELDDTEDVATAIDLEELADPRALPFLSKSLFMEGAKDVMTAILVTQDKCKYYNYEIFQAYLEAQKPDRQTSKNSDSFAARSVRSPITQNFYAPVNAVAGNVEGNLIAPPPDSVE